MRLWRWILFACLINGLAVANPAVVWLWRETGLHPDLTRLAATLRGQGFDVHTKSCAELGAANGLKTSAPEVLVLPYGRYYPITLAATLADYSGRGGALVITGGEHSFNTPFYPPKPGAVTPMRTDDVVAVITPTIKWEQAIAGPKDRARVRVNGETIRIALDLEAYAYAGIDLPPLNAEDAVIELQVRGEQGARWLSLDFQEKDGTRWKHILPVTSEWSTRRAHLGRFSSYNNKARDTSGRKWLKANRAARLLVGMTRAMGGRGALTIELRDLRFLSSPVTGAQVKNTPCFVDEDLSVARWFGRKEVEASPEILSPRIKGVAHPIRGNGRILRLQAGTYKGARWAVFDLPNDHGSGAVEAITEAVTKLTTSVWQQAPQPRFRVKGERVVLDVALPLINPTPKPVNVSVDFRMDSKKIGSHEFSLPPRRSEPTELCLARGLDAPQLNAAAFELRAETRSNMGAVFGPDTFQLDARARLREICDFFIRSSQADGRLHGYSFIDNRGIRVLLSGYEIFGDRRYLDAAMRWGMTMLSEQRADGGYRMGYGITYKGEECYVADGGEIVVGILRLANYADQPLSERFLSSADQYMRYREDFRVDTGGIGVGWCLRDYGKRPVTPLKAPTRILAPERNTYTIGCSLAGAYGHAALRNQKELYQRAEMDADWLMPRVKRINGAFAESFVFAHAFAPTPERRKRYATYLQTALVDPMLERKGAWWSHGKGRHALNLFGLVYYVNRIDERPDVKSEIYRALCAMFSAEVSGSIPATIAAGSMRQPEWLYISFGSLGLADFVSPLVSMD